MAYCYQLIQLSPKTNSYSLFIIIFKVPPHFAFALSLRPAIGLIATDSSFLDKLALTDDTNSRCWRSQDVEFQQDSKVRIPKNSVKYRYIYIGRDLVNLKPTGNAGIIYDFSTILVRGLGLIIVSISISFSIFSFVFRFRVENNIRFSFSFCKTNIHKFRFSSISVLENIA